MTRRNLLTILPLLLATLLMTACNGTASRPETVTDIDGNRYSTIEIGGKVWMTSNLKTTRYRNGDPIPEVADAAEWPRLETGARCSYGNNAENGKTFGFLYNWFAVNDPRGLAPEGWHVATDAEWQALADAVGGAEQAGKVLKSSEKWEGSTGDASKSSGFDALPSGARRNADGEFLMLGKFARFWTSTPANGDKALGRALSFYDNTLRGGEVGPKNGFAVRCVKD
ncbi:MAG: fibrobacter succinogenes major paralogous domain-containing protein [Chlorobiaceae bacterium]|nr:fibrobacter succinogenes major paralogous domain-containing protein [Chlorobiaceae bacterium]